MQQTLTHVPTHLLSNLRRGLQHVCLRLRLLLLLLRRLLRLRLRLQLLRLLLLRLRLLLLLLLLAGLQLPHGAQLVQLSGGVAPGGGALRSWRGGGGSHPWDGVYQI